MTLTVKSEDHHAHFKATAWGDLMTSYASRFDSMEEFSNGKDLHH